MEYHRTKDILHVIRLLGHKNIKDTLIYIDLEKAICGEPRDDATTLEETCDLLEAGFDYVIDMDGRKLFRKRK